MNFLNLSDADLYKKCREIGAAMLKLRRRFCGMLPEVARRKLYEKYGMHSVYEFAAKLGGVNDEIVQEVLRVHRLLEDKPILKEKLITGEVGYTKLRAVATIARPETQNLWLEKVQTMSKPALEMYVSELKKDTPGGENFQPGLPGKPFETLSLTVKTDTAAQMRVFKKRLEKEFKKPLNWDEALTLMLQKLAKPERKRLNKKAGLAKQQPPSRPISAVISNELEENYNGVCAFNGCNRPSEIFHHTERWALKPEHNLETIVPLCKGHERIAHSGLIENENQHPKNWHLLLEPDREHPKYFVDKVVQGFRMPP